MPRTKLDPPVKIDWCIAVLLYRKLALGYNWSDIADRAGMNGDTLRKLVSDKPSEEWPLYVLRKVLRAVDLDYRTFLMMNQEDEN